MEKSTAYGLAKLFSFSCGRSRHELDPSVRTRFHQAGNSFSNTEFGATNLRCQCRDRAAGRDHNARVKGTTAQFPSICPHAACFAGRHRPSRYLRMPVQWRRREARPCSESACKTRPPSGPFFHHAGHARAAQPLSAKFAGGDPHDTIARISAPYWIIYIILRFKHFSQRQAALALRQPVETSFQRDHTGILRARNLLLRTPRSRWISSHVMAFGCGPQIRRPRCTHVRAPFLRQQLCRVRRCRVPPVAGRCPSCQRRTDCSTG